MLECQRLGFRKSATADRTGTTASFVSEPTRFGGNAAHVFMEEEMLVGVPRESKER
jgi:hypothetical protein